MSERDAIPDLLANSAFPAAVKNTESVSYLVSQVREVAVLTSADIHNMHIPGGVSKR